MTRVCKECFPKGSYKGQRDDGFYMNPLLKENLDVLVQNIGFDFDFAIIISGGGKVRVGKSVIGMQIGFYLTEQIKKRYGITVSYSVKDNFVFNGEDLITKGNKLGQKYKYSVLNYDEAAEDLEGRKVMMKSTRNVLDYLRECGQYNMFNIFVVPDFFDLPKAIAITRTICLIDVSYVADEKGFFRRGYFKFYNPPRKKYLYLNGKKYMDYNAGRWSFNGRFYNMYPLDETEYRKAKLEALKNRKKAGNKYLDQRNACWVIMNEELGLTQEKIADLMRKKVDGYWAKQVISLGIQQYKRDV